MNISISSTVATPSPTRAGIHRLTGLRDSHTIVWRQRPGQERVSFEETGGDKHAMMALLRPTMEGVGAVAATRPPARRTAVRVGLGDTRAQGSAAVGWGGRRSRCRDARHLLLCGGGALAAVVRRRGLPRLHGGARSAAATLSTPKSRLKVH